MECRCCVRPSIAAGECFMLNAPTFASGLYPALREDIGSRWGVPHLQRRRPFL